MLAFKNIVMVIFSIGSQITFAQKNKLNFPILELSTIAEISQNDSYITLPTDIGNIKPLMFEANINPSFTIRERKDSRLIALLTPQIIIRMYKRHTL